ncbi:hypothetical protein T05_16375, partial [Trichinella murrelli]
LRQQRSGLFSHHHGGQYNWNPTDLDCKAVDRQWKATVDDINVVNKIHDRAHYNRFPFDSKCSQTIRMTAACKLFPHILASARTQRQVIAISH